MRLFILCLPFANVSCSGLLALAAGNNAAAAQSFERVLQFDQTNYVALNNLAVAHLYSGRLRQAMTLLENALQQFTTRALGETLIFNLFTLYELESDQALERKKRILGIIASSCGEHFNVECLKGL